MKEVLFHTLPVLLFNLSWPNYKFCRSHHQIAASFNFQLFNIVASIVLVLMIALSISDEEVYSYEYSYSDDIINMTQHPYTLDYQCQQQKREEMLNYYGYKVPKEKVEKRSALSLEEFWDLYDGKWSVLFSFCCFWKVKFMRTFYIQF